MKKLVIFFAVTLIVMGMVSCKKTNSDSSTNLRFINVSPNSGTLDVYGNSALIVGGVSYNSASAYQSINAATSSMTITQGGTTNAIVSGSISLNPNIYYSVIAYDSVSKLKVDFIVDDRTAPPTGKTFVRFFNYVNGIPVDIIKAGSTANKLFSNRTYLDHDVAANNYTAYTALDPGPFSISAVVAGTSVLVTQLPSFDATAGKSYTIVLKGFTSGTGTQAIFLGPITDN
jgi:hypothetical protein